MLWQLTFFILNRSVERLLGRSGLYCPRPICPLRNPALGGTFATNRVCFRQSPEKGFNLSHQQRFQRR